MKRFMSLLVCILLSFNIFISVRASAFVVAPVAIPFLKMLVTAVTVAYGTKVVGNTFTDVDAEKVSTDVWEKLENGSKLIPHMTPTLEDACRVLAGEDPLTTSVEILSYLENIRQNGISIANIFHLGGKYLVDEVANTIYSSEYFPATVTDGVPFPTTFFINKSYDVSAATSPVKYYSFMNLSSGSIFEPWRNIVSYPYTKYTWTSSPYLIKLNRAAYESYNYGWTGYYFDFTISIPNVDDKIRIECVKRLSTNQITNGLVTNVNYSLVHPDGTVTSAYPFATGNLDNIGSGSALGTSVLTSFIKENILPVLRDSGISFRIASTPDYSLFDPLFFGFQNLVGMRSGDTRAMNGYDITVADSLAFPDILPGYSSQTLEAIEAPVIVPREADVDTPIEIEIQPKDPDPDDDDNNNKDKPEVWFPIHVVPNDTPPAEWANDVVPFEFPGGVIDPETGHIIDPSTGEVLEPDPDYVQPPIIDPDPDPDTDTNTQPDANPNYTGILQKILTAVLDLPKKIGDGIQTIFIPNADSFRDSVDTIKTTFDDQFPIIPQIVDISDKLSATGDEWRIKIPFIRKFSNSPVNYKDGLDGSYIVLPDEFEDTYRIYARDVMKALVYFMFLFLCIKRLFPRITFTDGGK